MKQAPAVFPLLVGLLAGVVISPAFAESLPTKSSHFSGFNVDFGVGASQNSLKMGSSGHNEIDVITALFLPDGTQTKLNGIFDFSYNFALTKRWLIGIGTTYSLYNTKMATGDTFLTTLTDYKAAYSLMNQHSLYLKPMYAMTDDTAIYAKLGYHTATDSMTFSGMAGDFVEINGTYFSRAKGPEFGAGMIHLLSQHLYVKVEVTVASLSARRRIPFNIYNGFSTTIRTKSTTGLVAIGYRF